METGKKGKNMEMEFTSTQKHKYTKDSGWTTKSMGTENIHQWKVSTKVIGKTTKNMERGCS